MIYVYCICQIIIIINTTLFFQHVKNIYSKCNKLPVWHTNDNNQINIKCKYRYIV